MKTIANPTQLRAFALGAFQPLQFMTAKMVCKSFDCAAIASTLGVGGGSREARGYLTLSLSIYIYIYMCMHPKDELGKTSLGSDV